MSAHTVTKKPNSSFFKMGKKNENSTYNSNNIVNASYSNSILFSRLNKSTKPSLNRGKKWRVGYYEGGEYFDYKKYFIATLNGLMELGWMESAKIPIDTGDHTEDIWKWLNTSMKSKYIEFVKDGYYSAHWDENIQPKITNSIINRLNTKKDIDLMLVFGTCAGKNLANDRHSTPTIILATSDPVGAGIVKGDRYSGFTHVHAHVDPSLYRRQLLVFHTVVKFKKLGIMYENTQAGKSYTALDAINQISRQRRFEVISCYTKSDIADQATAEESVLQCVRKLCKEVDALYVTQQGGVNGNTIPKIVEIANKHYIPTFSQAGTQEVKKGVFMSISNASSKYVGSFQADVIAKVLNGAKPGNLNQIYESPNRIAINLKTGYLIGFPVQNKLLRVTDDFFTNIEK